MSSDPRCLALALLALSTGCGELAEEDYLGEPLLTLEGDVVLDGLINLDPDQLKVALFWSGPNGELLAEQAVFTEAEFPAHYRIELFHPPAPEVMLNLGAMDGWRAAVGHPLIYLDADGDGTWSPGLEQLVGGSLDTVVLYNQSAPYDARLGTPDARDFGTGFQRMTPPVEVCGDAQHVMAGLEPATTSQTHLAIGSMWPRLHDWDCNEVALTSVLDTQILQLDAVCPPSADLAFFCDHAEDLKDDVVAGWDQVLRDCMLDFCPELDTLRRVEDRLGTCPDLDLAVEACDDQTNQQLSLSDTCAGTLCDLDPSIPVQGLRSCPSAEDMVIYCERPDQAVRDDVHEACMWLYCTNGDPKEPAGPDDTSSSSSSSDRGTVHHNPPPDPTKKNRIDDDD